MFFILNHKRIQEYVSKIFGRIPRCKAKQSSFVPLHTRVAPEMPLQAQTRNLLSFLRVLRWHKCHSHGPPCPGTTPSRATHCAFYGPGDAGRAFL